MAEELAHVAAIAGVASAVVLTVLSFGILLIRFLTEVFMSWQSKRRWRKALRDSERS